MYFRSDFKEEERSQDTSVVLYLYGRRKLGAQRR